MGLIQGAIICEMVLAVSLLGESNSRSRDYINYQLSTINCQLSTRPNLKIDNKLKTKRDKAPIVSAIFCGDIR